MTGEVNTIFKTLGAWEMFLKLTLSQEKTPQIAGVRYRIHEELEAGHRKADFYLNMASLSEV